MKTTIVSIFAILILILSLPSASTPAQFCSGFESGYVAGYQQSNNTSLTPLVPICPMQPMKGFGDPESDFEHGYQIGFLRGMNS